MGSGPNARINIDDGGRHPYLPAPAARDALLSLSPMFRSLLKSITGPAPGSEPAAAASAAAPALPAPPATTGAEIDGASRRILAARQSGREVETLAQAREELQGDARNLQALLVEAGLLLAEHPEQAEVLYARAVALRPASGALLHQLAQVRQRLGRIAEATAAMRLAVAAEPGVREHRFALFSLLFLGGQYREGFLVFRARDDEAERARRHPWLQALPAWDGGPLDGQRLLVWTDWGGLGDELQFARYIELTRRHFHPAALLVNCSAQNRRLFSRIEGVDQAFDQGGVLSVDCHVPLLDLPGIFGTDLGSVPAPVPYLRPDPADVAAWTARLAPLSGLKVGLCWSSGIWSDQAHHQASRHNKSLSLAVLAPLCAIEGVNLVSLQKGGARPELAASGLPILDFDAYLNDMADTAALASCLDLIITVDTSVSHLAGALGRPTLLLLPHGSGSFWLTQTERSPWYPTLRLLRQGGEGDWAGVAARAEALLRARAANGRVDVFA